MSGNRVHYLDWLKVLIVYGILLFHVSLVFAVNTWLVSNAERSVALSAFAGFCFPWGIPAMFLIAGADAYFGLRSNTPAQFLWKRVWRLLVPMGLGLILLSPYQRFVSSHNPPPPLTELPSFYVTFFSSMTFEADPEWISRYFLHLWFLGYLFVISVACLPLLVGMRREAGVRMTGLLIRVAKLRAGYLLLATPLLASQLILRPRFPAYQDWADLATYVFVFLMGALIFSDTRWETAIRRDIAWILATGVISTIGLAVFLGSARYDLFDISLGSPLELIGTALFWTLDVWSWNLAVLYLGIRWLRSPHWILDRTRESVLPFYVIHHPVVITVASFVVTWPLGLWPKFILIAIFGYAFTIGLFELAVRPWPVMRAVFGLGAPDVPSIVGREALVPAWHRSDAGVRRLNR